MSPGHMRYGMAPAIRDEWSEGVRRHEKGQYEPWPYTVRYEPWPPQELGGSVAKTTLLVPAAPWGSMPAGNPLLRAPVHLLRREEGLRLGVLGIENLLEACAAQRMVIFTT